MEPYCPTVLDISPLAPMYTIPVILAFTRLVVILPEGAHLVGFGMEVIYCVRKVS